MSKKHLSAYEMGDKGQVCMYKIIVLVLFFRNVDKASNFLIIPNDWDITISWIFKFAKTIVNKGYADTKSSL